MTLHYLFLCAEFFLFFKPSFYFIFPYFTRRPAKLSFFSQPFTLVVFLPFFQPLYTFCVDILLAHNDDPAKMRSLMFVFCFHFLAFFLFFCFVFFFQFTILFVNAIPFHNYQREVRGHNYQVLVWWQGEDRWHRHDIHQPFFVYGGGCKTEEKKTKNLIDSTKAIPYYTTTFFVCSFTLETFVIIRKHFEFDVSVGPSAIFTCLLTHLSERASDSFFELRD